MVDFTQMPEGEREEALRQLKQDEARAPFDLATGPLLRVTLVTQGVDHHMLLFTMHHIVCDGWSLGILLREIYLHTEARQRGEVLDVPPPVHYGEYAQRQRQRLDGPELERLLGYWEKRFEGAPALLELPTDRPRPAEQSYAGAGHSFTFSRELSAHCVLSPGARTRRCT